MEQLVAIEDLEHAALVGAVAEIHPVALRPGGDRPMGSAGMVPVAPGS